jgi:hypothetical protein
MRRFICALILVLLPTAAFAQHKRPGVIFVRHSNRDCCYGNRFSLEPYGGVIKDAFDVSPDDKNTSALVGLRLGYQLGWRTRLLANVGYSKSDDVANPQGLPAYFIYDNTWVFTTAGAEFDVVPGRTSAALGLQAGAAWRRVDLDGQVGTPLGTSQEDSGFHASDVIVPSLTLRQRISNRLTISAGVHDNIFDVFDGPAKHGLAATFGVAFR